ncbi:MAG: ferrochelatase [Candidatus Omnitrophota bacterium]
MTVDVILLSYGEPPSATFFQQWAYSCRILNKLTRRAAPIPRPLIPFIGVFRACKRVMAWRRYDYGSPLDAITEKQAQAIQEALNRERKEITWRVRAVFEFRQPLFVPCLRDLRASDCERLVIVPLYAAYSGFTAEISLLDYKKFQKRYGDSLPRAKYVLFRPCLRELANIMAEFILSQIKNVEWIDPQNSALLLGAHGTVTTPIRGIKDAGYKDTFTLYKMIEEKLRPSFREIDIGWLNHRVGGEWTQPTLDVSVRRMMQEGITRFVYFPFGFIADNAETQLEGKIVFENLGVKDYLHLPCINTDSSFINMLTKRIIRCAGASAA